MASTIAAARDARTVISRFPRSAGLQPRVNATLKGRATSFSQSEDAQRQAGDRGDVLLAVDLVSDRTADDLRTEARLPQQRPVPRIDRLEVSFAAAREQHVGRRRQDAAVGDIR